MRNYTPIHFSAGISKARRDIRLFGDAEQVYYLREPTTTETGLGCDKPLHVGIPSEMSDAPGSA
jgi:hypothetical protein